jgi:hypothetical protein
MADISREELIAFTVSHEKVAVVLDKIATQLELIATKQDKLIEKLQNGITETIINGVVRDYNITHKETIECLQRIELANKDMKDKFPIEVATQINNSSVAKDVGYAKWFILIVGLIVIVASVILRGIDNKIITKQETSNSQVIQHLLEQHMHSTGELK